MCLNENWGEDCCWMNEDALPQTECQGTLVWLGIADHGLWRIIKVTQVSCMPRTNLLRFYLTLPWLQLRARFCRLCPGSEEWSCYILDKVGCPRNRSGCPSFLSEKKSCRILTGSTAAAYLYIPGHLKIYFNHLGYFDMPRHNQCITCTNKKQQCIESCLSCPVPSPPQALTALFILNTTPLFYMHQETPASHRLCPKSISGQQLLVLGQRLCLPDSFDTNMF